jgi:hypothetical protein
VIEMLYQDKALGQPSVVARMTSALRVMFSSKRQQDLDLLSMNGHLRRDLGLSDVPPFTGGEIWRK